MAEHLVAQYMTEPGSLFKLLMTQSIMGCDIYSDSIPEGSVEAETLNKIAQLCDFKKLKWSTSHQEGCLGLYCGGGLSSLNRALRSEGIKLKHFYADAWLPFEFAKPLNTKKINKILFDASAQNEMTLEEAISQAIAKKPMELSEILSVVQELGYKFPASYSTTRALNTISTAQTKVDLANNRTTPVEEKVSNCKKNEPYDDGTIFTYEQLFDAVEIGSIPYLIAELTELSNWLSIPKELLALTHNELKIFVTKYNRHDECHESYLHYPWLDLYSQALFCQEENGILALSV